MVGDDPSSVAGLSHPVKRLALRTDTFKEHDEVPLEKCHRIDGRSPHMGSITVFNELADETQIEFRLDLAVKVILGNKIV